MTDTLMLSSITIRYKAPAWKADMCIRHVFDSVRYYYADIVPKNLARNSYLILIAESIDTVIFVLPVTIPLLSLKLKLSLLFFIIYIGLRIILIYSLKIYFCPILAFLFFFFMGGDWVQILIYSDIILVQLLPNLFTFPGTVWRGCIILDRYFL